MSAPGVVDRRGRPAGGEGPGPTRPALLVALVAGLVLVLGLSAWSVLDASTGAASDAATAAATEGATEGATDGAADGAGGQDPRTDGPAPSRQPQRDPWLRPFRSDSIWNTPIGADAALVPAGLPVAAKGVSFDRTYLVRAKAGDPERPLLQPRAFDDRCAGQQPTGRTLRVPDDLVIPDAQPNGRGGFHTPNNGLVVLRPDGRTTDNTNGVARCERGGPVHGYSTGDPEIDTSDLYGDGRLGTHGASRLSYMGGALREGELTGDEPIRHVLDLLVWARHLSFRDGGHRWPAIAADSYASPETYTGSHDELRMGSLLALPPDATPEDVGVTSAIGRKLFAALQDYGAYVTDDAAFDHHYLVAEAGTYESVAFGDAEQRELNVMVSRLHVVTDNTESTVGGAGERRRPLLPELVAPDE